MKEELRDKDYQKKYGITLRQYNAMLKEQGGVCAVCKSPPNGSRLAVDHDHKTGKVRSLLCTKCNLALGAVNDSPSLLRSMISYLRRHV